jgi:hypothetical protein
MTLIFRSNDRYMIITTKAMMMKLYEENHMKLTFITYLFKWNDDGVVVLVYWKVYRYII